MAEPYLICPPSWHRGTLEPDAAAGLILDVESGGTPSTTNDSFWDGDIPWLTPKEVTHLGDGVYVSSTERCITKVGLAASAAKLLAPGTVMLTKRAPVGSVAMNAVPMATNQGFLNFTCGPLIRPLYLAYWLRASTPYLHLVANGSTYPELYAGDLFEFEISVPAVEVQDAIISVIGALQFASLIGEPLEQIVAKPTRLLASQSHSRRVRALRDSILPLLLSGVLDVGTLTDRLAEVR